MTAATAITTASAATYGRVSRRLGVGMATTARSAPGDSDAARDPVTLGGSSDATDLGHRPAVGTNGVGHLSRAVEQSLELALVQADAHDLALELVCHVGELGDDADVRRETGERIARDVANAAKIGPPAVREVFVERDEPGVIRPGHHPATTLLEQSDTDLATELMVDVTADSERQVHPLGFEPRDLLAEEFEWRVVVVPRHAEELVVAFVAAEDRVRQVEEHDRRLGEVREPFVLDAAPRHQLASGGSFHHVVGV